MSLSISVVMPTYNRATFIEHALDSLALQTTPALEIVIVDDASTDDTHERVQTHRLASRIRYLRNDRSQGASESRNRGVREAAGDVIVFLDSDDLLETEHHGLATSVLSTAPDTALFCCDAFMIGPDGDSLPDRRSWTEVQCQLKGVRIDSGLRSLRDIFLFSTPFPGFTIRRDVYRSVGGLAQSIFPLDDYDLQLRVAGAGHGVHYEHRPLARYRVHGGNESGAARAVKVGEKKLRCLEKAVAAYPALRAAEARPRERLAEVRRELAVSLIQDGRRLRGCWQMFRAACNYPPATREMYVMTRRRVGRWLDGRSAS